MNEITSNLMNRAIYIHNHICRVLLSSYEYLQDHIIKMSVHLTEYERKNLNFEYVNCQEKLKKICQIAQVSLLSLIITKSLYHIHSKKKLCNDPETLDDLANRHVAQCSAENIMQWCLYLDNFSLNQSIQPHLATEYHSKRVIIL
jgi:hypothetical protein